MFRTLTLSVFVLTANVAHAQTVVSFHSLSTGAGDILIASVPTGGMVLTDIVSTRNDVTDVRLEVFDGANNEGVVLRFNLAFGYLHLNSGIDLAEGKTIKIGYDGFPPGGTVALTLMGYIPGGGGGTVPAVSDVGLVIMVILILAGGAFVLNKRQQQAA